MRAIAAIAALMLVPAARLAAALAGEEGDRDRVQGAWAVSSGEKAGRSAPEEGLKDLTVTFAGGTFLWKTGTKETRGTFALDPTKSPRAIRMTADGETLAGVYRLEGDELEICVGIGEDRPADFTAGAGAKVVRLTLRRKAP